MKNEYLELQTTEFGTLYIKIQKETDCFYFINQYPNLKLIPVIGILRLSKSKEFLQINKEKNYSEIGFKIINKVTSIPSKIIAHRIYE